MRTPFTPTPCFYAYAWRQMAWSVRVVDVAGRRTEPQWCDRLAGATHARRADEGSRAASTDLRTLAKLVSQRASGRAGQLVPGQRIMLRWSR